MEGLEGLEGGAGSRVRTGLQGGPGITEELEPAKGIITSDHGMAATWEDVFIDLGLMSDADYERVNNMSLQEMGRYITMMTRDPLYWNKWKARTLAVLFDQALAGAQHNTACRARRAARS